MHAGEEPRTAEGTPWLTWLAIAPGLACMAAAIVVGEPTAKEAGDPVVMATGEPFAIAGEASAELVA